MKKIFLLFLLLIVAVGCSKTSDRSVIEKIDKQIENSNNYQMIADLDIYRNEEQYSYSVISTYEKNEKYKVELVNKKNNHEQIILKNENFVYVITPSLNKSFKFQSDWPNNNSQIYLLQPIIADLKGDENTKFEQKEEYKILTSLVNYTNEKKFKKQKVYINKNDSITKVEVVDNNNEIKMVLNVKNIDFNKKISKNFFEPSEYIKEIIDNKEKLKEDETSKLEEYVYPMYVPVETYLTTQDIIETNEGERMIMTFSGDSEFVFIQEKNNLLDLETYVYGDPYLILDTIGSITDGMVTWISNGVEYSIVSDKLPVDELITIAQSIGVEPVGK